MTGDGQDVACWKDKSANFNDMVQTTGASVPIYVAAGTTVNFDGTDDFMDAVSDNGIPYGASARSVFASTRSLLTSGYRMYFAYGESDNLDGNSNTMGQSGTTCWYDGQGLSYRLNSTSCVTTSQHLTSMIYDGTTGYLYQDGSQVDTNTFTLDTTVGVVRLGNQNRAVSEYWDGDISEILLYDADLTPTEQQKVEGYLACKWGTQGALPGGHPYATYCP